MSIVLGKDMERVVENIHGVTGKYINPGLGIRWLISCSRRWASSKPSSR
jgi:hypothetical protein